MSFLAVTLPASILLAALLLALVLRAAREGQFDDWEGPAFRHLYDEDDCPELELPMADPHAAAGPHGSVPADAHGSVPADGPTALPQPREYAPGHGHRRGR